MTEAARAKDEVQVWRVRRRWSRWGAWLALGAMVAPVLGVLLLGFLQEILHVPRYFENGILIAWLVSWGAAPVFALASLLLSMRRRLAVTGLEARNGDLRLALRGKEAPQPQGKLESALLVVGDEDVAEVEVELASGNTLCIRPGSEERGRALVEELGFGAAQRRVALPLGGAREPLSAGCGGVLLGMMAAVLTTCLGAVASQGRGGLSDVLPFVIGLVFVGISLASARALAPKRLVVGSDGVLFQGGFRKRFFPRATIFGAERIGQHLALLIDDGGADVREINLTSEAGDRQDALLRRIREALDLPAQGSADPRAATLARGAEPIEKWRERLRKMVAPATGYRGERIPSETLVQTAADVSARVEDRVGAAMAIGLGEDAAAKAELRKALDTIANDKIRIAIESAASGEADEEALAAAMEEEERARKA